MNTRRHFLSQIANTSLLAFLPLPTQLLFAETGSPADAIIDEVDVLRVMGHFTWTLGTTVERGEQQIIHHFLRIRTRGGIEGIYGYVDEPAIPPILDEIRPFILGKNAFEIEALWEQLYRRNRHSRAGYYMMGLSYMNNALWDIRGKYFGMPVYQVLGGATRSEAPVYASTLRYSVAKGEAGPQAKELYDKGFRIQKWFFDYGVEDGNAGLQKNIELVAEVREALGPDAQIMFDPMRIWDLPYAKAWARAVAEYNPYYLEEPFWVNKLENYIELSRVAPFSIAAGEHLYTRWDVQYFLKAGAIQFVNADPEWCGGVSELVKICAIASGFGAKVIPHGHNIHAALHVSASQSQELCPFNEYLNTSFPWKLHFQKDPLLTDNGVIPLPTKPGFGIELDEGKIERSEVLTEV